MKWYNEHSYYTFLNFLRPLTAYNEHLKFILLLFPFLSTSKRLIMTSYILLIYFSFLTINSQLTVTPLNLS